MGQGRAFYPIMVGWLLGVLQTGLFFQLTFTLSSGYVTYLMITLCWLLGGAVGVYLLKEVHVPLRLFLVLMLAAYAACGLLVSANPFNTQIWPAYALLIGVAGVYPGVFFARASRQYAARRLFLLENNGFIAGLVACTVVFMLAGRGSLWVLPVFAAVVVWWLSGSPFAPSTLKPATEKI